MCCEIVTSSKAAAKNKFAGAKRPGEYRFGSEFRYVEIDSDF
jgi:hypothetical protein